MTPVDPGNVHLPVQRHRGLDAPGARPSARGRTATSSSATACSLRAAFAAHGGSEQGTEGDSFFVDLPRPAEARRGRRRRAAGARRPNRGRTAPRSASGWGSIPASSERTGDGVVGYDDQPHGTRSRPPAHGGQVLLSDGDPRARRRRPADRASASATSGEHRLKDLRAPERLAQLVIDGLPADFPAPRSLDARPNNLPTQLTTFVGRERELGEAGALLARDPPAHPHRARAGPARRGSSLQVAAEVGRRASRTGSGSSPSTPSRDPTLVVADDRADAGHRRQRGRAGRSTASPTTIGDRRVLLVLDNFEQVVGGRPDRGRAAAPLPDGHLPGHDAASPCTSRASRSTRSRACRPRPTRLACRGRSAEPPARAARLDLDALSQFEAVRLFIARATRGPPGFDRDQRQRPGGGRDRRAARTACRWPSSSPRRGSSCSSPDQILARLDHHLATLTGGSRDLPERQQTLRGAIAWSYDLLDDGARRLLDRLSVFRGGFDLPMAEAVGGPRRRDRRRRHRPDRRARRPEPGAARRRDRSPIEPRFAMLETIREYAAEMLATGGEADAIGRRHADGVPGPGAGGRTAPARHRPADVARPARARPRQPPGGARLDGRARPERWPSTPPSRCGGSGSSAAISIEARARLEAMAARGWDLEPIDRARFAEAFGGVAYWQSDRGRGHPLVRRGARASGASSGDRREIANALYNRAYADMIVVMEGRGRGGRRWRPGADARARRSPSTPSSATPAARAT